jgi:hypothetical protein
VTMTLFLLSGSLDKVNARQYSRVSQSVTETISA